MTCVVCSAGNAVPWLDVGQRDVMLAANASQGVTLAYKSAGIAAGTYRMQLCLFADYDYGNCLVRQGHSNEQHWLSKTV